LREISYQACENCTSSKTYEKSR